MNIVVRTCPTFRLDLNTNISEQTRTKYIEILLLTCRVHIQLCFSNFKLALNEDYLEIKRSSLPKQNFVAIATPKSKINAAR